MTTKKTKLPIEFNLLRVDGETASVVQCMALAMHSTLRVIVSTNV
jgi:hypothetical protein